MVQGCQKSHFFVVPPRFFYKQNMAIFLGHFPADFCIECAGTVIYYFCSKVHPVDGGGAGAQHRQRCHTAGVLHLPKWGWGMRRSENVTYCRNSSLWDLWTMPLHQFCQSQLSFPNTLYRDRKQKAQWVSLQLGSSRAVRHTFRC